MEALMCDYLKNSIWHAFNALDLNTEGSVPKPRLQVFITTLGSLVHVKNVEKGLMDYRSTSYLKYKEFLFYLQKELFTTLSENIVAYQFKDLQANIDDVCWLICKHIFVDPTIDTYPGDFYFKLFRIFCVLADFSDESNIVQLDISEVNFVTELLDKALGKDLDDANNMSFSTDGGGFSFEKFLFFIKVLYEDHCEKEAVIEAVNEVYDTIVENIIKKGPLKKSLTPVGPWWEMWFVLKQHSLIWYLSKNRKDKSGEINLYTTEVEVKNGTGNNFVLTFGSKSMNLYAADCATKFQWTTAFGVAIKNSKTFEPLQQSSAINRKKLRFYTQTKLGEKHLSDPPFHDHQKLEESLRNLSGNIKHPEDVEEDKALNELQLKIVAEIQEKKHLLIQKETELEKERLKRVELEMFKKTCQFDIDKLTNDITSLKKDKEKLSETLEAKFQLEETLLKEKQRMKAYEEREKILLEQLKEERQAKEDEEIVRDLQSRKLAEEWERIEVMEREQEEKEAELYAERKRREELELWQKKREQEIDDLATVVTNLEKEKEELHGTLKRTKVLLAQPRKTETAQSFMKRSHSADFSSIKIGNLSLSSKMEENC